MFTSLLTALVAALAIGTQTVQPPPRFERGMERRGVPVVSADFVGMEWPCARASHPTQDEVCYAGLDTESGLLVTGP